LSIDRWGWPGSWVRESIDPESTDDSGSEITSVWWAAYATHAARRLAALAAEAVAAVDGLAARRTEGDLGLLAARGTGRREHFARTAVTVAVATATTTVATCAAGVASTGAVAGTATLAIASSLAAGSAGRAPSRLGEAALGIEVLLGRGEHEFLSTVRTGQVLVVVHGNRNSSRRSTRSLHRVLASVVRGVRVRRFVVCGCERFSQHYPRSIRRFVDSGYPRITGFATMHRSSLRSSPEAARIASSIDRTRVTPGSATSTPTPMATP
jgi:hypothetical protein